MFCTPSARWAGRLRLAPYFETIHRPRLMIGLSDRTVQAYRESVAYWSRLTRDPRIHRVRLEDLQQFQRGLLDADLSPPTTNKHARHVQRVLRTAGPPAVSPDGQDLIGPPPRVRRLPEDLRLPRRIDPAWLVRIWQATPSATKPWPKSPQRNALWWRAWLAVALSSGFRRSALLSLRWADLDRVGHQITLQPEGHKRRRAQLLPLHAFALDCMLQLEPRWPAIFYWPWAPITLDRTWHRLQKAAGLTRAELGGRWLGTHDLRRACASMLNQAGAAEATIALILDHRSPTTTRRYINPGPAVTQAVRQLELPFEDPPGPRLAGATG
jgi:integrase